MTAFTIASAPVEMAGFPVTKNAEAALDTNYATQLKKWLKCQDYILGMQDFSMRATPMLSVEVHRLKTSGAEVAKQLIAEGEPAIDQLRRAPLEYKRAVLSYMHIIPVSIAAVFLGLSEKNLNDWQQCWSIFGKSYAGAHCYSLNELYVIANNRGQIFTGLVAEEVRDVSTVAHTALDEVVMVEEKVAAALANMSLDEIHDRLPRNALIRRPFRLSDLEKIRVAKLNATA